MPDITSTIDAVLAADEQPVTVIIYQSDGEPYRSALDGSESTISFLGSESKKVRAAQDRNLRRYVRSRGRGNQEAESARRGRIERAIAAVTAWHGWESGGRTADPTPENLEQLFRVEHILQQAEEAISEHARFFAKPSAT